MKKRELLVTLLVRLLFTLITVSNLSNSLFAYLWRSHATHKLSGFTRTFSSFWFLCKPKQLNILAKGTFPRSDINFWCGLFHSILENHAMLAVRQWTCLFIENLSSPWDESVEEWYFLNGFLSYVFHMHIKQNNTFIESS